MLIQSYKVPEGQMDSVARRMSFLKDKLKDWCYQASIQKNMKRLRGTIKRTPLCCENNDFPTIIGESGEPRKRRKQRSDSYSRDSKRTPFRRRSWWSKTKARSYKSGQRSGPTRASSQGSRRKDTRSTGRTPTKRTFRRAHTRTNESFKDCNCWTCGARGHIAPDCPQKRGEIRKFKATDDILDAVYYGELVPIYQFEDLPSDESVYEEEIETDSNGSSTDVKQNYGKNHASRFQLSPYDGFRIGGIGKVLNQIGLNQRKHHIIYKSKFRKEYIEIPRIFKEFAKVMAPDPVRIPRIGGVDIVIKDHLVLDRTMSSRTEFSSRMSFSEDRIIGYKEKEKDLSKVLTPQEIRVDNVKLRCPEGWKENTGVAGLENGSMILGISFFEDHKPWGRKGNGLIDSDSFHEESEEEIKNLKEAMQELKTMDISEESQLSLENVKRLIQRNFSENPLAWWDRNKIEATLKIKEECKYEYVRYKPIQMNMEDKKNMQMIIKEHINLGLIEPGISAYSSPGFLVRNHGEIKRGLVLSEKKATIAVNKIEFLGILIDETGIELQEHIMEKIRNFPDILKDKKQLQSFLGVVNFVGIFIKDLAKYRKDFRPLLKETESAKWKWEEIHTQRVRELKQVCNNLPKLAIPQDEDELVVYTDANDYRWAAVLMKKTTTGEEPCRYTGGLFTEQQAQVWHINEKEFFAVWKAFKKWPLILLAKNSL
ncbi:UNVERIFIED_CONTAM: Enzymatic polyprotein [Sesamum angustifolium]|uniref:Enzymatic polyprotein n=1 Tax=Sesamum angustifolium TaxID=2727405 RepID=A0AAW2LYN9_9LAMI